ncbi:MAG TPA: hypothetical protein VGJ26_01195 [Pirellulales bacterium]|jgi:hypothetical protein
MAPVSLTWTTIDDETGFRCGAPAGEPQGPYALANVLAEIIERYAPPASREQLLPATWTIQTGSIAFDPALIPVLSR